MPVLRNYLGFEELDAGVIFLDWIIDQHIKSEFSYNKFFGDFMLPSFKGLQLWKASGLGEVFLPSPPVTKSSGLSAR